MQRDPPQLPAIHLDGMHARRRSHLVRDRQHTGEVVLTSDIEVRLDLRALQLRRARLHLDQARPRPTGPARLEHAVGVDGAILGLERHFDEGPQLARRRAEPPDHRLAELPDRAHHRQQGRRRPPLGLLRTVDAARRNQPSRLPCLFCHLNAPQWLRARTVNTVGVTGRRGEVPARYESTRRSPSSILMNSSAVAATSGRARRGWARHRPRLASSRSPISTRVTAPGRSTTSPPNTRGMRRTAESWRISPRFITARVRTGWDERPRRRTRKPTPRRRDDLGGPGPQRVPRREHLQRQPHMFAVTSGLFDGRQPLSKRSAPATTAWREAAENFERRQAVLFAERIT